MGEPKGSEISMSKRIGPGAVRSARGCLVMGRHLFHELRRKDRPGKRRHRAAPSGGLGIRRLGLGQGWTSSGQALPKCPYERSARLPGNGKHLFHEPRRKDRPGKRRHRAAPSGGLGIRRLYSGGAGRALPKRPCERSAPLPGDGARLFQALRRKDRPGKRQLRTHPSGGLGIHRR